MSSIHRTVLSSDIWNSTLSFIIFTIYHYMKQPYSSFNLLYVVATIISDIWLLKSTMWFTNTFIQKTGKHNSCLMNTILFFLRIFP